MPHPIKPLVDDRPIHQILREVRLRLGMPQTELARRLGVFVQTLYQIETGKVMLKAEIARAAARHLGVSVAVLFGEQEQPADLLPKRTAA